MNYAAVDVKKLREETGATFADCKNALNDAASWDEALKIIDAKRDKKAEKMQVADRETKQGGVFSQIAGAHPVPRYINFEDVPAEVIAEAGKAIEEDPSMERVPAEKREEVINNKLKKSLGEQVLMMQPWIKDETVVTGDLVRKVIAETGENIVLRRFSRFELGK